MTAAAATILSIEDDPVLSRLLVGEIAKMGYRTHGVGCWAEGRAWLEANEADLVILDCRLPDADGIELLPQLVPDRPVVVLTAYGSVSHAVRAMKNGAAEYLIKPIDLDELEVVIERVLAAAVLRREHDFLKSRLEERHHHDMIGASPAIDAVRDMIEAVAPSDMTVLITGESGVGKELVAHAIHKQSDRAERTFVAVDCCTLQESLFESELFGHEKGAFTGADRAKKGLIENAAEGTLFLDEIGEIGPSIQAKLLRVLETGRFRRVGGMKDLQANVRIVAATNRDLDSTAREGGFRSDLFYRLNGFIIDVPPLRDRPEDIAALAASFIRNHDFSRRIDKRLSQVAMERLAAYGWPGNVRELKNVVERAIILSGERGEIGPEHITVGAAPRTAGGPDSGITLAFDHEPTLDEIKDLYFSRLLERHEGKRAQVARIMGISERSTYRMLARLDDDA